MKHYRLNLSWLIAVTPLLANAQPYWRPIGLGPVGIWAIQNIFGDSVQDKLLAGGSFERLRNQNDTILGMGLAAWNGHRWDSLATRITDSPASSFQFLRYNGHLYTCGNYLMGLPNGAVNEGLARLNEQTMVWEPLECINPDGPGVNQLGPQQSQGSSIYATGFKASLCGYPEACVFRYDGTAFHEWEPWSPVPMSPNHDDYVGILIEFQGMTFMSGVYPNPNGSGFRYFMCHNGTDWEEVPGWNNAYHIRDALVHGDTLYVCGIFTQSSGAPGNLVAAFDGSAWSDMAGGLALTDPNAGLGTAKDLEWHNGRLYVGGHFNLAGGTPLTSGVAIWDGSAWSGLPGAFTNPPQMGNVNLALIRDLTFWRDSLYICGSFNGVDGQPAGQVAQFLGALPGAVGMPEAHGTSALLVSPNPTTGLLTVRGLSASASRIEVHDAAGRRVLQLAPFNGQIDLSAQPSSIYALTVLDAGGLPLARAPVVKQ